MLEIYITHGTRFPSYVNMHPYGTLKGKWQLSSWCHRRPTPPWPLQIDPLPPSPCCIPAAAGVSCSPFSQPPLPTPYFSGSKRGGLQWRAPRNLCLTISIWQLLWIPTARWKGQKPWLCWGGVPGETYVNKDQLCSLLHLTLFSHSCLDLRWN